MVEIHHPLNVIITRRNDTPRGPGPDRQKKPNNLDWVK